MNACDGFMSLPFKPEGTHTWRDRTHAVLYLTITGNLTLTFKAQNNVTSSYISNTRNVHPRRPTRYAVLHAISGLNLSAGNSYIDRQTRFHMYCDRVTRPTPTI